jgi:putative SOS response-associated peptidase YedK
MCGRYTITSPSEAIREIFGVSWPEDLAPRYNVAPTQDVPIVRRPRDGAPGAREAATVRWGLIPFWAKEAAIGNRLINARADGVATKPAFRDSFAKRRCLVVADGFYEWRKTGGRKQPYWIRLASRRPFAFAGLWSRWRDPAGAPLESCTIVTTEANEACRAIHPRMPVILRPEDHDRWLDPDPADAELLRPFDAEPMEAIAVSTRVNSPGNDDPGVLDPAERQPGLL